MIKLQFMDRKNFIKSIGLGGVLQLPLNFHTCFSSKNNNTRGGCVLIPSETPGPFPLDPLRTNSFVMILQKDLQERQCYKKSSCRFKYQPMQNIELTSGVASLWAFIRDITI